MLVMDQEPTRTRNALQELIETRLAELGISQRQACANTRGALTPSTLNRILKGHHHQITTKTIQGLSLALDVNVSRVEEAANTSNLPNEWREMLERVDTLSPQRQREVVDFVSAALKDQALERKAAMAAERPFRARRRRG